MEEQNKIILQGSKIWNAWKKEHFSIYFNQPSWYKCLDASGMMIKGNNELDFTGMDFTDVSIHSAFAEGLNLSGSTFVNTHFEEGDFSRANFSNATFLNTKFNKTILTDAEFTGASFVNCNLNRVNLTNAKFCVKEIKETVVYGISAWDLHTCEEMHQSKLVIEKTYDLYSDLVASNQVPLTVSDIELAQFIHYLRDHKKMRDTINILNSKSVLLIGQFKEGGMDRLNTLYEMLEQQGYMPMIFDFARPNSLDITETIVTMSGLSKFVIADLSGKSVPQELYAITSNFQKPIIAYSIGKPFALFKDIKRRNPNVMDIRITSDDELLDGIIPLLPKAEKLNKKLIAELAESHYRG